MHSLLSYDTSPAASLPVPRYSNSANQNFGVLRVMNDDLIQPNRGFGAHPHEDMEVRTL